MPSLSFVTLAEANSENPIYVSAMYQQFPVLEA
jgi:hypothetical protein